MVLFIQICRRTNSVGSDPLSHLTCNLTGRPCCVGIQALCLITTLEHCDFLGGRFHQSAFLCSQVTIHIFHITCKVHTCLGKSCLDVVWYKYTCMYMCRWIVLMRSVGCYHLLRKIALIKSIACGFLCSCMEGMCVCVCVCVS